MRPFLVIYQPRNDNIIMALFVFKLKRVDQSDNERWLRYRGPFKSSHIIKKTGWHKDTLSVIEKMAKTLGKYMISWMV